MGKKKYLTLILKLKFNNFKFACWEVHAMMTYYPYHSMS